LLGCWPTDSHQLQKKNPKFLADPVTLHLPTPRVVPRQLGAVYAKPPLGRSFLDGGPRRAPLHFPNQARLRRSGSIAYMTPTEHRSRRRGVRNPGLIVPGVETG